MGEWELLKRIKENVIQGRQEKGDRGFNEADREGNPYPDQLAVNELMEEALKAGIEPEALLAAVTEGRRVAGRNFRAKKYFIPDVLASAKAADAALQLLTPFLKKETLRKTTKVILATVKGDFHDIGKIIVGLIFKGEELEVIDLGFDVSEEKIIEKIRLENPQVLGLSALLTTTMVEMGRVIEKLKAEGLRETVKVIVGGAPLSQEFAEEIGADGYAPDAFSGVALVRNLLGRKK